MESYYFGRLNFIGKRNLVELLNSGFTYRPDNNIKYGIFDVETIEEENYGNFITGELVKYVDYTSSDVVKDGKISSITFENSIKGKCRFFIHEKNHLIAYNPYGKIIAPKAFREAFSGVLINADDSMEVDSLIYPVNEEYNFIKQFKSMKVVRKLVINLTPSNPNNRDVWKTIDDKLNEMEVKNYKEIFTAKSGKSLSLQKEEENKIVMAEDGYGKATSEGLDEDGNKITISTDSKDSILKKNVPKNRTIKQHLTILKKVFDQIRSRFKDENN